jgi:hypothetical protein
MIRAYIVLQSFSGDKHGHGLTHHLLEAEEDKAEIKEKFGIKRFPTAYLIDREGRILTGRVGFKAGDETVLEKEIMEILSN